MAAAVAVATACSLDGSSCGLYHCLQLRWQQLRLAATTACSLDGSSLMWPLPLPAPAALLRSLPVKVPAKQAVNYVASLRATDVSCNTSTYCTTDSLRMTKQLAGWLVC